MVLGFDCFVLLLISVCSVWVCGFRCLRFVSLGVCGFVILAGGCVVWDGISGYFFGI